MTQPTIPMTSAVASWLVTIGQICSGAGALLLATDPSAIPFSLDAYNVGLTLVFASNLATVIVVALRKNVVPLVTSGTGTEGP